MVVDRIVGPLDVEAVAIGGHPNPAFLKRDQETITIGINFDENGFRFLREVLDFPRLHQSTPLQDDDPVTGAFDINHQVRRKKHADTELPVRFPDERQHLLASSGVEPGGGFVEKHDRGVMHQGLRQLYSLFHARRVTAHRAVPLLKKACVSERVCSADTGSARRKAAHLGHVGQKLGGRDGGRQTVVFRHVPEPGAYGDALGRVLAENRRRTGCRLEKTQENLDGGGFACAVLAENAGDPLGYLEADAVERDDVLVVLREVLSDQQCCHGVHLE